MRLVDTNVLLYAVSSLPDEVNKRRRALDLLNESDLALSVQVLQEFYYQATHPKRPAAITEAQAVRFIDSLGRFPVQDGTLGIFHEGGRNQPAFRAVVLGRGDLGGGALARMRRGVLRRPERRAGLRRPPGDQPVCRPEANRMTAQYDGIEFGKRGRLRRQRE